MAMAKEGVDRLSLLPDDILIDILSLLPLRDAITTGILSKRWRNLWTHITYLNVNTYFRSDILSLAIGLPKLLNVQRLSLVYKKYVTPVCLRVLRFNIHELKVLSINPRDKIQHILFTYLIFQLTSLVVLELHYCWVIHPDISDSVTFSSLMNLKVLKLRFDYNDGGYLPLLERIINYCPLLEELSLLVWHKSKSSLPGWYKRIDDSKVSDFVFINAPNLKNLKLHCYPLSKFYFPSKSLQSVDLRGGYGALDQSIMLNLNNIFEVSSRARSLTLGSPSIMDRETRTTMLASQVHLKCLPNLVHLKCTVCCSMEDVTDLMVLLSKCPALQVLILNFTDSILGHSELLLCDIEDPGSLATLKRVVINLSSPSFSRCAFFVVKYLLESASVLERLIINVTAEECEQICRDFLTLPRKSVVCQVELYKV